MGRNTIETVMGAVVLLVAGVFLWLAFSITGVQSGTGQRLSATFGNIGGLGVGDEVRISGITVGKVTAMELDPVKFNARIIVEIDENISLASDSAMRIASSSLLGGNYVEIIPGFEDDIIADGGVIADTRDPVSLSDLIGKAVFSGVGK